MVEEGVLLKGLTGQRATVRAPLELITFGSLPCFILLFNSLSRTSPQVVLFGDSLTQRSWETPSGWASQLATLHCRKTDVFNRGYGGYNTRWAKFVLPSLFPLTENAEEQPKHILVTIWFGANDAALPTEHAHVPVDEYEQNLRAIVKHVKRCALFVVVITPPPVHGPTRLAYQQRAYGDSGRATGVLERSTETAAAYAAAASRVARSEHVALLDVFGLMLTERAVSGGQGAVTHLQHLHPHSSPQRWEAENSVWPQFVGGPPPSSSTDAAGYGDGLHLSPAGNQFVGEKLRQLLSYGTSSDSPPPPSSLSSLDGETVKSRFEESKNMLRGFRDLLERLPAELPYGRDVDPSAYAASMKAHQRDARLLVGQEDARDSRYLLASANRPTKKDGAYFPPSGNGHLPELHKFGAHHAEASTHGGGAFFLLLTGSFVAGALLVFSVLRPRATIIAKREQ